MDSARPSLADRVLLKLGLKRREPEPEPTVEDWLAQIRPQGSCVGAGQVSIGRWTYWDESTMFFAYKPGDIIDVGSFCSVAAHVRLLAGGDHNTDHLSQYPFNLMKWPEPFVAEPQPIQRIAVGNDVWFGDGAIVLGNVTVGDGAVIGAGAVVTRDVAPYAIVVGSPAREIRKRFDAETIVRLQRVAWWGWPDEAILEAEDIMRSNDIDALETFARSRGLLSKETR